MKLLKCLLIFLNLVFMVSGIVLVITGTAMEHLNTEYFHFVGNNLEKGSILLIVAGSIIFFVTFCGCCGIINDSFCLVMIYSASLSILIILEFYAGFATYMHKTHLRGIISSKMKKGMLDYNMTNFPGMTHAWDGIQTHLKCCGTENFLDWNETIVWNVAGHNGSVPDSCCKIVEDGCGFQVYPYHDDVIYTNGCLATFFDLIKENISIVGGVGVGIGFTQMIGAIFSCYLANSIRKEGYMSVSQKEY